MQRNNTTLGRLLSIAAFAMLTLTQWLHSPLHHLAEFAAESSAAEATSRQHNCSHSHSLAEHSHDGHAHSHTHAHDRSTADQSANEDCPGHQHPHPDDECDICVFVARSVGQVSDSVCLVGLESVELVPDSVAVHLTVTEQTHLLIRGPPALNS